MKRLWILMLLCLTFIGAASRGQASTGDLRPLLKKTKSFVKTRLPGRETDRPEAWKVFRTFTSTKTKIDISWEGNEKEDEILSLQIEAFPEISQAEKSLSDLERFLTFEATETKTVKIHDLGDIGYYSYIKRFPNYLDHIIDLNFRKGRFVVQINAPSDKIARALARFVEGEIGNLIKLEKP